MASRDAESRIPLLNAEAPLREDVQIGLKTRGAVLLGVAGVAALAMAGMSNAGTTTMTTALGLPGDDGSGRPTLYAMLDNSSLSDQLKHLQCYRKMANDAGMQLAVGEYTSEAFEDTIHLDDVVDKQTHGWRTMTKGDWQRIEEAGGPDLCITARDKTDSKHDNAKYSYPGGTIESIPNDVITEYDDVINELKTREWWTCLGSQAFDVCQEQDAQLDFKPSPHITEVMKIARKSLFGKAESFKAIHLDDSKKNKDKKIEAFHDVCKEAKAGMGPPVYVATESTEPKTHRKLHKMGCITYQNITGYDMLQDWELRALDQFLMADAEEHITTQCTAMDSIAAASRKASDKEQTRVYVATADAYLDFPNENGEQSCQKAKRAMEAGADTHKESEKAFTDKVNDAAALVEEAMKKEEEASRAAGGGDVDDDETSEASEETSEEGDVAQFMEGEQPSGVEGEAQPALSEGEQPAGVDGEQPVQQSGAPVAPLPAGAEDRVSAIESDVHDLKDGMEKMMSTLFNIQQSVSGGAGASSAADAAKEAAKASESTEDSVARIVAEAKAARAAVDAAKITSSDAKKTAEGSKTPSATASKSATAKSAKTSPGSDDKVDMKKLDKKVAAAAAKTSAVDINAPVEKEDLESYEAQMMEGH